MNIVPQQNSHFFRTWFSEFALDENEHLLQNAKNAVQFSVFGH